MDKLKYYEVRFENEEEFSICIRGKRKPTTKEATEFCETDCKMFGRVIDVLEIDSDEAHLFFDMDNEESFPVFG